MVVVFFATGFFLVATSTFFDVESGFFSAMAVDNFVFCRSGNFIETTEGVIFNFLLSFSQPIKSAQI